jgi:hypothetical protein
MERSLKKSLREDALFDLINSAEASGLLAETYKETLKIIEEVNKDRQNGVNPWSYLMNEEFLEALEELKLSNPEIDKYYLMDFIKEIK